MGFEKKTTSFEVEVFVALWSKGRKIRIAVATIVFITYGKDNSEILMNSEIEGVFIF